IVTEFEGTTRDLLEEGLVINGLPVRLIDAAGIRESSDPVERVGVQRARDRIESVDIVLLLIDGSCAMDKQDQLALDSCSDRRHILVVTKSDLPLIAILPDDYTGQSVYISARKGEGLNELRDRIHTELLDDRTFGEHSVLLTSQRHQAAAIGAVEALTQFESALQQNFSLEFLALDLSVALAALGDITGETTTDDVLDSIFSRFCIGK
ncbi:MAG: 50S ribosome-binding GTPase, partial [Geopsychrobacter sp.]|nr:50S ribosome-binding GTPase [Geopsychrobacter sp.]